MTFVLVRPVEDGEKVPLLAQTRKLFLQKKMRMDDFFREIPDWEDSPGHACPEIGTAQINVFEWDARLFYLS
ncbi:MULTISPECIES: hypothetical protein [unclassified Akkermansia]|uniref:hypothetical protein n=1 Tax=unclassified Akkermansia TaxID=2608915 RepID=UPI001BFF8DE2|nr:hypothetical protein [Akkermansia muciniphila]MBT8775301.1 hypothetical protein [Akkermansia muciniphila]